MYLFDLNHKIKQLNRLLYVDQARVSLVAKDIWGTGIYLKSHKRSENTVGYGLHYVDSKTQEYMNSHHEGTADTFICGVPTPYVPEYDTYDLVKGTIIERGWRSIVLTLVQKKLCTLERARNVFSRSLGEQPYDKWTYEQRLVAARGGKEELSANEQLQRMNGGLRA